MIIWILYILVMMVFTAWLIHLGRQNNNTGLPKESALYGELYNIAKNEKNPFMEAEYEIYRTVVKKSKTEEIEHALAITSGNLQTTNVDSTVFALVPTICSICSFLFASQLEPWNEINVEFVANLLNLGLLAIYMWLMSSVYSSVKRQGYFKTIMQFELDKRREESVKQQKSEYKKQIHMLERKVKHIKRKKIKEIHIIVGK